MRSGWCGDHDRADAVGNGVTGQHEYRQVAAGRGCEPDLIALHHQPSPTSPQPVPIRRSSAGRGSAGWPKPPRRRLTAECRRNPCLWITGDALEMARQRSGSPQLGRPNLSFVRRRQVPHTAGSVVGGSCGGGHGGLWWGAVEGKGAEGKADAASPDASRNPGIAGDQHFPPGGDGGMPAVRGTSGSTGRVPGGGKGSSVRRDV